jgi:type VI secretion system protein ImpC
MSTPTASAALVGAANQNFAETGARAFEAFGEDFDADLKSEPDKVKSLGALATVLQGTVVKDRNLARGINGLITEIDNILSAQINLIIHHPKFQKLEGTWRGLERMVKSVEAGPNLKMHIFNASKEELRDLFEEFSGSEWDSSPLFKKLYTDGMGILGGRPVGMIVGDYEFDHTSGDMTVLKGMAQIASAGHAPFITGCAPNLFGIKSWSQLANIKNPRNTFEQPGYEKWNAFRNSPDAMYAGLAMPRYLARGSYGEGKENPGKFAFTEDTLKTDKEGKVPDDTKYCWSNAAYAMAERVLVSNDLYGWGTQICGMEAGGRLDDLPTDTYPGSGGALQTKISTEVAIDGRLERNLSLGDDKNLGGCGLMPLVHRKHENCAVFMGAQSAYNPKVDKKNPEATFNERLSAKLPNIFACSRFAHALKCILRDKVGGTLKSKEDLQRFLNNWIQRYVFTGNPDLASARDLAESPLQKADVIVEDDPANPGFFRAHFKVTPLYKLEGVEVSLSLVKMKSGGE